MIGEMIADSLRISLRYAERLAVDIPAADFGKLARIEGRVVDSNHPAWVYGHLAIYVPRIFDGLDRDSSPYRVTESWIELFGAKSQCQDDPEGTLYPDKEQLVEKVLTGYRAAEQILRETADEEPFRRPNPNETMRSHFSTLGGMFGFYTGGHFMIHMGQISAWRRMMGLGSAM